LYGNVQWKSARPFNLNRDVQACLDLAHRFFVSLQLQGKIMTIGTILLIVLVLILIGALPTWGHSRSWGYAPSGITGLLVVVLLIMLVTGRI